MHRLADGEKFVQKLFDGQLFVHQLLNNGLGLLFRFGGSRLEKRMSGILIDCAAFRFCFERLLKIIYIGFASAQLE